MFSSYSNFCRRQGLTLIEVVTALALLSTLLVAMLVAFQKNAARIRSELTVREVAAGVDELLLEWARQGLYPPVQAEGQLPKIDGFTWETRVVSRQFRNTLGLDIVRLQVRAEQATHRSVPVISIELPVPAVSDQASAETTP
ncbi:MAG: prepilin-type N-terminal cleavage/methylation domain-containing protein [Pirellulaceae bacterium]